jgi:hypothetical protein
MSTTEQRTAAPEGAAAAGPTNHDRTSVDDTQALDSPSTSRTLPGFGDEDNAFYERALLNPGSCMPRVTAGPRVPTTLDMTDDQLASLDPGARMPKNVPTPEQADWLREVRREQVELERLMPTGVAR